jgi:hypothetical protein
MRGIQENHVWTRNFKQCINSPDLRLCQAGDVDVVLLAVVSQDEVLQCHLNLHPKIIQLSNPPCAELKPVN